MAPNHSTKLALWARPSRWSWGFEQQGHPAGDDQEGGDDDEGTEQPQQHRRWALAHVGGVARVVAVDPVAGAGRLHQYRGHQHHADEDVGGEQAPDVAQDGQTLGREQHEEVAPMVPVMRALAATPGASCASDGWA